jgi:biopolymer transport protein ExbB
MSAFWYDLRLWWSNGQMLMPIMLGAAMLLYLLVGERLVALFGPASRRARRADEIERLMAIDHAAEPDLAWRAWAARYVAAAEETELTRGFVLIRVLTVCLPLLGLLGTVAGMVDTFGALSQRGSGGVSMQQAGGGIGLALAATQYGMTLAIPAVVAEWILRRRVETLVAHREALASGLIAAPSPREGRV